MKKQSRFVALTRKVTDVVGGMRGYGDWVGKTAAERELILVVKHSSRQLAEAIVKAVPKLKTDINIRLALGELDIEDVDLLLAHNKEHK